MANEYQRLKGELYQTFLTSNSRGFSDKQVRSAKECVRMSRVRLRLSSAESYECFPFVEILRNNDVS